MRKSVGKLIIIVALFVSMLSMPITTIAGLFDRVNNDGFVLKFNDDKTLTLESYDGDRDVIGSKQWDKLYGSIPKKIVKIGDKAFQNNKKLKSFTAPTAAKSIGNNAFDGCSNLESVTLGSNVTNIGSNAFRNCTSLRKIIISGTATIGKNAFSGCDNLREIIFGGSRYEWKVLVDSGIGVNSKAVVTCRTVKNHFLDVEPGMYYTYAAAWAYENQITTGVDQAHLYFSPHQPCTRAEVVTFLWRMWSCPGSTLTKSPFVDVNMNEYYYKALLWAYERGVVTGKDTTHFDPNGIVTRAEFVTMLWRSRLKPYSNIENTFVDVDNSSYYVDAVRWAVEKDITRGVGDNKFDPDGKCTRAQTVTFLCRADKIWGQ